MGQGVQFPGKSGCRPLSPGWALGEPQTCPTTSQPPGLCWRLPVEGRGWWRGETSSWEGEPRPSQYLPPPQCSLARPLGAAVKAAPPAGQTATPSPTSQPLPSSQAPPELQPPLGQDTSSRTGAGRRGATSLPELLAGRVSAEPHRAGRPGHPGESSSTGQGGSRGITPPPPGGVSGLAPRAHPPCKSRVPASCLPPA